MNTGRVLARVDYAVVGGGIVALAVARSIVQRAERNTTVAMLERNSAAACEQTGHNSGVVHSGLFYSPGSNRATHCVAGHSRMLTFISENNLPLKRCGKLVVASSESEAHQLNMLHSRGISNGVEGLDMLSEREALRLEPNIRCSHGALASHNTAVTDYEQVALQMLHELHSTGRMSAFYRFACDAIERNADGELCVSGTEPGQAGPRKTVVCKKAVTCAGLRSDEVAAASGDGNRSKKVFPFRGRYLALTKNAETKAPSACIYPASSGRSFLGVHTTPYLSSARGSATLLGPAAFLAPSRQGYSWSLSTFSAREVARSVCDTRFMRMAMRSPIKVMKQLYTDVSTKAFLNDAKRVLPWISEKDVEPSFAGVRAQLLDDDGNLNDDFVIEHSGNVSGLVHVHNAPSPAATSSLSIAEEVTEKLIGQTMER